MKTYELSRYPDHAILKPELKEGEVRDAIKLGLKYQVRTVCVRSCDIDSAVSMCSGTKTGVSCVLGFPHGVSLSEMKATEAVGQKIKVKASGGIRNA